MIGFDNCYSSNHIKFLSLNTGGSSTSMSIFGGGGGFDDFGGGSVRVVVVAHTEMCHIVDLSRIV